MYDGTLATDWKAMIVFQQLVVLADPDGVVDYTPEALTRRTGIPLDIIEHGLAKLQKPEKYSRSKDSGGKRIILLDDHRPWGWLIVNYAYYCNLATARDRRADARDRKRKQRKNESQAIDSNDVSQDVTDGHAASLMSRHRDGDGTGTRDGTRRKTSTAHSVPDPNGQNFAEFKKSYPKRSGGQCWSRASKAINARFRDTDSLTWADLIAAALRYAAYCDATEITGTQFVQQAATFVGPEKHFRESWELPTTNSSGKTKGQIETTKRFLSKTEKQP